MSIEVSSYPPSHTQDTDHESWHFEHIEYLQESEGADRGDDFTMDLALVPVTDYFGLKRAIVVSHLGSPVSVLPDELTQEFWPLVTYLSERKDRLEVSARIWTSPENRDFYASVRIDLPPIEEVEDTVRYELNLDEDFTFAENPYFTNQIVDYTSERWRQAHGMTDEEYKACVEETRRQISKPFDSVPVAQGNSSQPSPREDKAWAALLTPDGTPRANLFQRGYVRGTIGKHFPGNKAPRIDYATVGQCKRILEQFGEPTGEVDKRNGFALKGLWWILLALLAIVGLIGLFTPPVGWVVLALVLSPFVYHYWTRRKLKPPFGKQA